MIQPVKSISVTPLLQGARKSYFSGTFLCSNCASNGFISITPPPNKDFPPPTYWTITIYDEATRDRVSATKFQSRSGTLTTPVDLSQFNNRLISFVGEVQFRSAFDPSFEAVFVSKLTFLVGLTTLLTENITHQWVYPFQPWLPTGTTKDSLWKKNILVDFPPTAPLSQNTMVKWFDDNTNNHHNHIFKHENDIKNYENDIKNYENYQNDKNNNHNNIPTHNNNINRNPDDLDSPSPGPLREDDDFPYDYVLYYPNLMIKNYTSVQNLRGFTLLITGTSQWSSQTLTNNTCTVNNVELPVLVNPLSDQKRLDVLFTAEMIQISRNWSTQGTFLTMNCNHGYHIRYNSSLDARIGIEYVSVMEIYDTTPVGGASDDWNGPNEHKKDRNGDNNHQICPFGNLLELPKTPKNEKTNEKTNKKTSEKTNEKTNEKNNEKNNDQKNYQNDEKSPTSLRLYPRALILDLATYALFYPIEIPVISAVAGVISPPPLYPTLLNPQFLSCRASIFFPNITYIKSVFDITIIHEGVKIPFFSQGQLAGMQASALPYAIVSLTPTLVSKYLSSTTQVHIVPLLNSSLTSPSMLDYEKIQWGGGGSDEEGGFDYNNNHHLHKNRFNNNHFNNKNNNNNNTTTNNNNDNNNNDSPTLYKTPIRIASGLSTLFPGNSLFPAPLPTEGYSVDITVTFPFVNGVEIDFQENDKNIAKIATCGFVFEHFSPDFKGTDEGNGLQHVEQEKKDNFLHNFSREKFSPKENQNQNEEKGEKKENQNFEKNENENSQMEKKDPPSGPSNSSLGWSPYTVKQSTSYPFIAAIDVGTKEQPPELTYISVSTPGFFINYLDFQIVNPNLFHFDEIVIEMPIGFSAINIIDSLSDWDQGALSLKKGSEFFDDLERGKEEEKSQKSHKNDKNEQNNPTNEKSLIQNSPKNEKSEKREKREKNPFTSFDLDDPSLPHPSSSHSAKLKVPDEITLRCLAYNKTSIYYKQHDTPVHTHIDIIDYSPYDTSISITITSISPTKITLLVEAPEGAMGNDFIGVICPFVNVDFSVVGIHDWRSPILRHLQYNFPPQLQPNEGNARTISTSLLSSLFSSFFPSPHSLLPTPLSPIYNDDYLNFNMTFYEKWQLSLGQDPFPMRLDMFEQLQLGSLWVFSFYRYDKPDPDGNYDGSFYQDDGVYLQENNNVSFHQNNGSDPNENYSLDNSNTNNNNNDLTTGNWLLPPEGPQGGDLSNTVPFWADFFPDFFSHLLFPKHEKNQTISKNQQNKISTIQKKHDNKITKNHKNQPNINPKTNPPNSSPSSLPNLISSSPGPKSQYPRRFVAYTATHTIPTQEQISFWILFLVVGIISAPVMLLIVTIYSLCYQYYDKCTHKCPFMQTSLWKMRFRVPYDESCELFDKGKFWFTESDDEDIFEETQSLLLKAHQRILSAQISDQFEFSSDGHVPFVVTKRRGDDGRNRFANNNNNNHNDGNRFLDKNHQNHQNCFSLNNSPTNADDSDGYDLNDLNPSSSLNSLPSNASNSGVGGVRGSNINNNGAGVVGNNNNNNNKNTTSTSRSQLLTTLAPPIITNAGAGVIGRNGNAKDTSGTQPNSYANNNNNNYTLTNNNTNNPSPRSPNDSPSTTRVSYDPRTGVGDGTGHSDADNTNSTGVSTAHYNPNNLNIGIPNSNYDPHNDAGVGITHYDPHTDGGVGVDYIEVVLTESYYGLDEVRSSAFFDETRSNAFLDDLSMVGKVNEGVLNQQVNGLGVSSGRDNYQTSDASLLYSSSNYGHINNNIDHIDRIDRSNSHFNASSDINNEKQNYTRPNSFINNEKQSQYHPNSNLSGSSLSFFGSPQTSASYLPLIMNDMGDFDADYNGNNQQNQPNRGKNQHNQQNQNQRNQGKNQLNLPPPRQIKFISKTPFIQQSTSSDDFTNANYNQLSNSSINVMKNDDYYSNNQGNGNNNSVNFLPVDQKNAQKNAQNQHNVNNNPHSFKSLAQSSSQCTNSIAGVPVMHSSTSMVHLNKVNNSNGNNNNNHNNLNNLSSDNPNNNNIMTPTLSNGLNRGPASLQQQSNLFSTAQVVRKKPNNNNNNNNNENNNNNFNNNNFSNNNKNNLTNHSIPLTHSKSRDDVDEITPLSSPTGKLELSKQQSILRREKRSASTLSPFESVDHKTLLKNIENQNPSLNTHHQNFNQFNNDHNGSDAILSLSLGNGINNVNNDNDRLSSPLGASGHFDLFYSLAENNNTAQNNNNNTNTNFQNNNITHNNKNNPKQQQQQQLITPILTKNLSSENIIHNDNRYDVISDSDSNNSDSYMYNPNLNKGDSDLYNPASNLKKGESDLYNPTSNKGDINSPKSRNISSNSNKGDQELQVFAFHGSPELLNGIGSNNNDHFIDNQNNNQNQNNQNQNNNQSNDAISFHQTNNTDAFLTPPGSEDGDNDRDGGYSPQLVNNDTNHNNNHSNYNNNNPTTKTNQTTTFTQRVNSSSLTGYDKTDDTMRTIPSSMPSKSIIPSGELVQPSKHQQKKKKAKK